MRFGVALAAPVIFGLSSGCQGQRTQSALHPESSAASAVAQLWWVLLAVLGLYSLAVFALMLVAIFRRPSESNSPPLGGRWFILMGGAILPSLILVPLLIYSVSTTAALRMRDSDLTIRVVGHLWWWEVEYPGQGIVTANEIHIPAGAPVRLELTSADVIHSFWVPQLHGKMDMLPGATTVFWIEADRPGTYRGQCAEFCGVQHAHMAFVVEALAPQDFEAWIAERAEPLDVATDDSHEGQQAFFRHGCAVCHAIAGTPAVGRAGPDLSWFGERQTIGAATVPNNDANLLAWLINPQAIKPGVNMPATHADVQELQKIVSYLQSLSREGVQR